MVMNTPRGIPVRTFPPKSMGMLPCLVEEAAENHCKKTPMIVNAGEVREGGERSSGVQTIGQSHAELSSVFLRKEASSYTPNEKSNETCSTEAELPDSWDDPFVIIIVLDIGKGSIILSES